MEAKNTSPLAEAEFLLATGQATEARRLIATLSEPEADREAWARLRDIGAWTDAWLIAAIRREPPDPPSLDELAQRHWRALFSRCQMLTLNRDRANDLAQETWCRVLRTRRNLKPEGNFPAYLHMIALNLWRDRCRAANRAGPLAEHRLASLEGGSPADDDLLALGDAVPDLPALEAQAQALLMLDVDHALERLNPLIRGVLVARFLTGESCAEIGLRHGRTQQTISGWIRQGLQEMKQYLSDNRRETSPPSQP